MKKKAHRQTMPMGFLLSCDTLAHARVCALAYMGVMAFLGVYYTIYYLFIF